MWPMEHYLHFTGDFHAIGQVIEHLLAALIDNHIFHGNALDMIEKIIENELC